MTREQYEMAVKAIMETATELLKKAVNEQDKIDVVAVQNLQIKAVTDEYLRSNN